MQTPNHVTRRATVIFLRIALLSGLLTASPLPVLANAGNEAASNSFQSFAEKKIEPGPFNCEAALDDLNEFLNSYKEWVDMFFIDLPPADYQQPVTIVAQSNAPHTSQKRESGYYARVGVCNAILAPKIDISSFKEIITRDSDDSDPDVRLSYKYTISPKLDVYQAFYLVDPDLVDYRGQPIPAEVLVNDRFDYTSIDLVDGIKIKTLESPKHGTLLNFKYGYYYFPNQAYIGSDRFVLEGEAEGHRVQLIYHIHVLKSDAFDKIKDDLVAQSRIRYKYCPNDTEWLLPGSKKRSVLPDHQ
ncbi:MAG: hypothetical protein LBP94_02825 [Zoogloeaceae bacterium]|jgi:hypothetical protein|nr:hypothetical protein [Zoogloeaceae bacterium]